MVPNYDKKNKTVSDKKSNDYVNVSVTYRLLSIAPFSSETNPARNIDIWRFCPEVGEF